MDYILLIKNIYINICRAQVVGWPPVRSFRKNSLAVQKNNSSKEASAAFVKVSVDGAPYLRKVDLKAFNSYQQLSQALTNMFTSSSTFGNFTCCTKI